MITEWTVSFRPFYLLYRSALLALICLPCWLAEQPPYPTYGPFEVPLEQIIAGLSPYIQQVAEDQLPWQTWDRELIKVMSQMVTGEPGLDRWIPRIAWELRKIGLDRAIHGRTLMGIARLEGAAEPGPWVSDRGSAGGPSVGPLCTYRATMKELGLWQGSRAEFIERGQIDFVATTIGWSVQEYAEKIRRIARATKRTEDDKRVIARAVRTYNGSGEAAEKYAEMVMSRLARVERQQP